MTQTVVCFKCTVLHRNGYIKLMSCSFVKSMQRRRKHSAYAIKFLLIFRFFIWWIVYPACSGRKYDSAAARDDEEPCGRCSNKLLGQKIHPALLRQWRRLPDLGNPLPRHILHLEEIHHVTALLSDHADLCSGNNGEHIHKVTK